MRYSAVLLALGLCSTGAAMGADFAGLWFACMPEWQARSPYALLEISREGNGYRWIHEWGQPYSAHGVGLLSHGKLVLRGCESYRGETKQGCDDSGPPVHLVLDKSHLGHRRASLRESLRRSDWIRTDSKSWQGLAGQCESLQEELAAAQQASSPTK